MVAIPDGRDCRRYHSRHYLFIYRSIRYFWPRGRLGYVFYYPSASNGCAHVDRSCYGHGRARHAAAHPKPIGRADDSRHIEWAVLGYCSSILSSLVNLVSTHDDGDRFFFCRYDGIFVFLRKIKLRSSLVVPIVGMMLGAVISAVATFWGWFSKEQSIETWFAGSFAPVQVGRYGICG